MFWAAFLLFAWTAASIVSGAVIERIRSGSYFQTFICVELRDPESFLATLGEAERRKCGSNRLVRLPCLLVPHGALDAPLKRIADAIRAALTREAGR